MIVIYFLIFRLAGERSAGLTKAISLSEELIAKLRAQASAKAVQEHPTTETAGWFY